MTTAVVYEVHAKRGNDWRIELILDDRHLAISEAKAILSRRRTPEVRVVQEKYNSATGSLASIVVFRESAPQGVLMGKRRMAPVEPETTTPPRPPAKPVAKSTKLALHLIAVCSGGVGVLIGLAYLVDRLR